jgi:cation transport ATPase
MARLVEHVQSDKAQVQRLADRVSGILAVRVSGIFVPIVIELSLSPLATRLLTRRSATAAFTAAVRS